MKNKIDANIAKVMDLQNEQHTNISCIIYVSNFELAKKYLIQNSCKIEREYKFINAFAVSSCSNNLRKLINKNFIEYISSHSKVFTMMNVAKNILCQSACNQLSGLGTSICFIDTGVYSHVDFTLKNNRIVYFKDFINDKPNCYDDNGHGTFITGVCSGNGMLSNGLFCGIAPNSNIISLKALDVNGEANAVKILDAMQWVYDNHKKFNIKIVCMSFGSEPLGVNDPIMKGAEELWNKGVCVIAAAGNSGPIKGTIKSPGTSLKIITVGGLNDNRIGEVYQPNFFEIASFSSRGPVNKRFKPDLIAPAVDISSCSNKGGYTKMSGTSVATPMIAGLASLIVEKKPKITPDTIKKILLLSCKGITFDKNNEGFGLPSFTQIDKILNNL